MRTKLELLTEICNDLGFDVRTDEFGGVCTASAKPVAKINREILEHFEVFKRPKETEWSMNDCLYPTPQVKEQMEKEKLEQQAYYTNMITTKEKMPYYAVPFEDVNHALKEWGIISFRYFGIPRGLQPGEFEMLCYCIGIDYEDDEDDI